MAVEKEEKPFSQVVAENLIAQLQAGTAPWQRPWKAGDPSAFLPMNPTTGKRYKGINSIHLMSQFRSDPRWMTYNQAANAGAQVRKGEKSTRIQIWHFTGEKNKLDENGVPYKDKDGNNIKVVYELERPFVTFARVFNAEQIDGLPPLQSKKLEQDWQVIERAERILAASGANITHSNGDRAFYRLATDSITLPEKEQFPSADAYYATALHELGHWTGHHTRLARDLAHPFGSEGYAKEELRAEIASMILGVEMGLGHDPGQHAAYVKSWIKVLQDDHMEIFRAASDADKIQKYVMAFEQEQTQQQSTEQVAAPELAPAFFDSKNVTLEMGMAEPLPDSRGLTTIGIGAGRDQQLSFEFVFEDTLDTIDRIREEANVDEELPIIALEQGTKNERVKQPSGTRQEGSQAGNTGTGEQATVQPLRLEDSGSLVLQQPAEGQGAGDAGRAGTPEPTAGTAGVGTGDADDDARARGVGERVGPARDSDGERGSDRVVTQHVPATDYTITDADRLGTGGAKTKFRDNVAAIRVLRQLQDEARPATTEEQATLVRYVGWGGIPQAFDMRNTDWEKEFKELAGLLPQDEYEAARRSTQDAHYTSETIIKGIYQGVERLGFAHGRILEPASGIGHFIGLQPEPIRANSSVTAIELDPTTAAIAKALYPKSTVINRGFQEVAVPSNMFDLAIGNPPFGNQKLYDPRHKDLSDFTIHNYFIAKSLDAVRPGGVVAVVVSNFFMDAGVSPAREHIAERANLVGAIRLPNNAFKQNAMTEVTTDIVFLQKLHEGQTPDRSWVNVGTVGDAATGNDIPLNQYYIDHPEMMLGRMALEGSMYAGGTPALVAEPGADLATELQRAIASLPQNIYSAAVPEVTQTAKPEDTEVFDVPRDVKIGAFFVSPRGRIAVREDDLLDEPQYRWAELKNDRVADRIKGLIEIRTSLRSLMAAERSESHSDAEIEERRATLNRVYDQFVNQHGFISSQTNKQAFVEDPEYALLHSLERDYDRGISKEVARKNNVEPREPSAKKAEIFSQRVMTPHREITRVETAKDALVVSMNETGKVDMELMVRLSEKSEEDLVRELGGLIYLTPQGKWETADRYLSGNVKQKLAEAVTAQEADSRFTANVEALQRVQPADIEPVDISVQLGSTWVPEAVVSDFVTHLLGDVRRSVSYAPSLGKWVASISPSSDRTTMRATWGTEDIPANELLSSILAGKPIQVKEVVGRLENGQPEYRVNEERTAAANQKADEIRQAFGDWIWEDKTRRETLARIYNDRFNTNVPPRYDGSHLVLPGSSKAITLRPHQKDAIWRGIQDGTALFDHVVGAGKTMVVIGTMMESRRMGLIKKPMIVVPNHLLLQWKDAFFELYPGANVLIAEKHEFKKENREKLFAKIATGNWDAVVVAHSSFKKIGMPEEMLNEILNEQIDDLTDSILKVKQDRGDRLTIKEMEKARDRMKSKLEKQSETGTKDRAVNFADLGVDALAIDEMHEFKNLFINTSMNRVSGLGNLAGSDKAFDMFVKVRYVQKMNEGRGVFGATGTPISNTIAELYTVQRYMHYDEMKARGIVHFDAWASTFGQVVTGWELDATGVNYRLNSRFAKFQNVPELTNLYRTFGDTITQTDLQAQAAAQGQRFPVPMVKGGKPQNIIMDRTDVQANYMGIQTPVLDGFGQPAMRADGLPITQWNEGSIIHRMENLPDDPRIDNPLKITNDARKAGLDFRLIDPNAPDFENTKVNEAVNRVFAKWEEWDDRGGTQLVFCDLSTPKAKRGAVDAPVQTDENDDGPEAPDEEQVISMDELLAGSGKFSVYDDMRAKLIARGIPEDQIAFIHDYNTDARKQKLFAEMNAGTKRILFGSTAKMGAGTNVQRRLVALHHLDAPWRPSDLEQREGRILRQGNMFYQADPEGFEVEVCRYSTKQTYDARMWQTIQGKAEGIEQFRRGDTLQRVIEDVASEAANAAEMKAAATGNPLIFQQVQLASDLKKMEAVYSSFKRSRHATETRVDWLSRADERADSLIDRARMEIALRDRNTKDDFEFHSNGAVFHKDDQSETLGVVMDAMKSALTDAKEGVKRSTQVGVYRGFKINVEATARSLQFTLHGSEKHVPLSLIYRDSDEFKLSGFFTRIDNYLARLDDRIPDAEADRAEQHTEYGRAKLELEKPFAQMAKLEMLGKDMGDVMTELKKAQADPSYQSTWEPLSYADAKTQEAALENIAATIESDGQMNAGGSQSAEREPSALEVAEAREVAGVDLAVDVAKTMPAVTHALNTLSPVFGIDPHDKETDNAYVMAFEKEQTQQQSTTQTASQELAPAFFDSRSQLLDAQTGEALAGDWQGLAQGEGRFWYIGQDAGERSFTALTAQTISDARNEAAIASALQVDISHVLNDPDLSFSHFEAFKGDTLESALRSRGLTTIGNVTGRDAAEFHTHAHNMLSPAFGIDSDYSEVDNAYLERKGLTQAFRDAAERLVMAQDQEQTQLAAQQSPQEAVAQHGVPGVMNEGGRLVDRLLRAGVMNHGDALVTDARRDLLVATAVTEKSDRETLAEVSEARLMFKIPPTWTGEVETRALAEVAGDVVWAEQAGVEPTFHGVYARTVDDQGELTYEWLIDYSTPEQAEQMAHRLALIDAYSQPEKQERDRRVAAIQSVMGKATDEEQAEVDPMSRLPDTWTGEITVLPLATIDGEVISAESANVDPEFYGIFVATADEKGEKKWVFLADFDTPQEADALAAQLDQRAAELAGQDKLMKLEPIVKMIATEKVWLDIPYKQKEAAKEAAGKLPDGGKAIDWDKDARRWFANPGANLANLAAWLPASEKEQRAAQPPSALQVDKPVVKEEKLSAQIDTATETVAVSGNLATEKTWLAIPYNQRIAARNVAGKLADGSQAIDWDETNKSWYANPGADLDKLKMWLPDRAREGQGPAQSPQEEFAEALRAMGCIVEGEHPIMDGERHRIRVEGDKTKNDRLGGGTYRGFLPAPGDRMPNGAPEIPAGYIKNHRTQIEMKWKAKGYTFTEEEKAQMHAASAAKLQKREAEQTAAYERVAKRVSDQTSRLTPITEATPYMAKKGIEPQQGAFTDSDKITMYLPVYDVDGKQWSMQYINSDGSSKRFAKESRKDGCFHVIGGDSPAALENAPAIVIGEGYSTVASVKQALGFPVVTAFDSGNLKAVAISLREKYPDKPFVFLGDDDTHLANSEIGRNTGRVKAEEAAREVRGVAIFPIFAPGEQTNDPAGYTDFNDLATKSVLGPEGLERQVKGFVDDVIAKQQSETQQQALVDEQVQERVQTLEVKRTRSAHM
jgi:N12 class adenine-specific DNA methylase/antirestriction protein ArdC/phage/plasmid primase-like uncharacterized protein